MGAAKASSANGAARQRRARGSLSREEILSAARELIERDGLHQLSFPRLAKQVGAGATSLYWYFHSKDELLGALVDEITKEMYLHLSPVGDGPWDQEIVDYHVAFRALLVSSPVYREVSAYRAQTLFAGSRMASFVLRSIESDLAMFVRAGLSPDEAVQAFNAFSVYTRAFVLAEHGVDGEEVDEDIAQLIEFSFNKLRGELQTLGSIDDFEHMIGLNEQLYRIGLHVLVAGLCERYPVLRTSASFGPHGAPTVDALP